VPAAVGIAVVLHMVAVVLRMVVVALHMLSFDMELVGQVYCNLDCIAAGLAAVHMGQAARKVTVECAVCVVCVMVAVDTVFALGTVTCLRRDLEDVKNLGMEEWRPDMPGMAGET
jgi:hypothetical protein